MANMQQFLNDEIRRLARKEVKLTVVPLQKVLVEAKHQISTLKKQLKSMETKLLTGDPEKIVDEICDDVKKIRMTPKMIVRLQNKLGLNRKQFAQLISANILSVSNWEKGKTVPRMAQKQKIAKIRSMGKREVNALLKEKNIEVKPRKKKATARKKASAAPAEKAAK